MTGVINNNYPCRICRQRVISEPDCNVCELCIQEFRTLTALLAEAEARIKEFESPLIGTKDTCKDCGCCLLFSAREIGDGYCHCCAHKRLAEVEQAAQWCWSGFVDGCDGGESLTRWPWLAEQAKEREVNDECAELGPGVADQDLPRHCGSGTDDQSRHD